MLTNESVKNCFIQTFAYEKLLKRVGLKETIAMGKMKEHLNEGKQLHYFDAPVQMMTSLS